MVYRPLTQLIMEGECLLRIWYCFSVSLIDSDYLTLILSLFDSHSLSFINISCPNFHTLVSSVRRVLENHEGKIKKGCKKKAKADAMNVQE